MHNAGYVAGHPTARRGSSPQLLALLDPTTAYIPQPNQQLPITSKTLQVDISFQMTTRRRSSQISSPPNPPPSSSTTTEPSGYAQSSFSQPPPRAPLQGKIALVTGATGAIGKAICRRLAALGCSIGLHYSGDQDGALALLEEFKEQYMHVFGSKFVCYGADLGRYDEVSPP